MNTPAHLIFGLAAFSKTDRRTEFLPVFAGSLAPDLSLYLMAGWAMVVQGLSPTVVFDQLYFSDAWQSVFALDNSFFVWGGLLTAGMALRHRWPLLMAGAALLHLMCDIALHNNDARQHFWPVSDWVFRSPFSYWDSSYHAGIIGPMEVGTSLLLAVVLWRRFGSVIARGCVVLLALAEALPGLMWAMLL